MSDHDISHDHNFAIANQEHFDAEAKAFDARPSAVELAKRIAKAMLDTYPNFFDESKTTVLDFACGSGLVSRELSPYVQSIVGVDISQGMVDQYNLRASNQGLAPEEVRAIRADLVSNSAVLNGQTFDLIVCAASYHHIADISQITQILASFLHPGGSLLVADILKHEGHEGRELLAHFKHVVPHRDGFSESEMRATFEKAGLEGFEFARQVTTAKLHGQDVDFFLARGRSAA